MPAQPAPTPAAQGMMPVDQGRLYYELTGSGPPLVLVHGFTLDHRMWDSQLSALSPHFTILRYDLRGFGRSSLPVAPYSHHADLQALLHALAIPRAHLLGLSLGASVVLDFALACPEMARSLVLVDASSIAGYPWHPELSRWFAAIRQAAAAGDLALAKQRWLETGWFAPARRDPLLRQRLDQLLETYSAWHLLNRDPHISPDPPAWQRLEQVSAPTLVVVGALDLSFYNLPLAAGLHRRIPAARALELPGVGHMANMEAPAAFNQAVLDFLLAQV